MMRTSTPKWLRLVLASLVLGALLSLSMLGGTPSASSQTAPPVGIACTYGPTFTLTAKPGYILLPDGNTMYMWGYSEGSKPFQHPGPVLCVNQGDTVTIVLQNTLPEPVSIILPGQEYVLADGAPAQPQYSGGNLTSLTNVAATGGSVTYSFVASQPGTYLYESGTDPEKQVRLGLFGALLVRPTLGAGYAYNRADTQYNPSNEFMVLLSEIDPYQHQAAERGLPFNVNNYRPRYWLINGRGFPDSLADNFAPWLPSQPYGALARVQPYDATVNPLPAVARYLSVLTEEAPFHPHGNNGRIVGRDGRPLEGPATEDLSFDKFAVNIGPGQTWDSLFKWYDAEHYHPSTNPLSVADPALQNLTIGMFYSGSPYLGTMGPMPPGMTTQNQCGEYYILAHTHALFELSSWGMNMTGPITFMRVDPPSPSGCP